MLSLPPSDPFSTFSAGFTPWDHDEDSHALFSPKPVSSSSGSDDKSEPNQHVSASSTAMEERKRRRMISNRESARRSRMRKQRHLENLRNQLNKCRVENRELSNRLQFVLHHLNRLRTENEWLHSERTLLRQKVANLTQILIFQQFQTFSPAWTCTNNNTSLMTINQVN
ncbi:hypothetical protein AAZX31_17G153800 [Glycine max]|uniref:BZIP transcription factor n=2 Tax=Glycine subgen. Soja TaxID=1462606 RepID=I1MVI7_SOYBN|eukprot:XP_014624888.1 basic leucine zipper 4 [Glycine max]